MTRRDFSSATYAEWSSKDMTENEEVCVADKERTMFRMAIESWEIRAT